ncbi:MAG: exonuclease domain-containing protein [Lachnospiraceae bacterium]|nr:exonuclease domain-containing protein [Lachnospiraceae bacterium]
MSKYVIVDLEMCMVPKPIRTHRYPWSAETIQIGAVLVDENLEIIDEFNTYVHPEYGAIDGFIRNLTGISSFDVKDASKVKEALEQFVDWVPEDAICVSWSNSDKKQICHEIEAKHINIPRLNMLLETWQDCQKTFSEKMDRKKQYRLSEALIAADIMFDENLHDGLVDAKNTAMLFIKMKKEPVLILNEYYRKSREDGLKSAMFTLGDICPALSVVFG